MKEYNKLVRDKIPEFLMEKGDLFKTHIADDDEFRVKLNEKLIEESHEFLGAKTEEEAKEEMADIFEVIDTILALRGWSREDIQHIQGKKHEDRGGFIKRIILERS
jgi:predicted house-cleaning noncanonical NTP pyrophosphatase (MazG superfamily)